MRPCPLCGSSNHALVSNRMQHGLDLNTVVCEECSFVYTNPVPPREVYERFYVEAYSRYYGHITPKPIGTRGSAEPAQLATKLNLIEQSLRLAGSRLLEIGPGNGFFLYWAQRRGCEVLGVEPSPGFCHVLAAAGLPHLEGVLSDVRPEIHGQFDIVFMAHVLEHFYDPNEALQHCSSLLKSNGVLAIEVPNILKPFRSLDRYFLRYVHLSNFSPQTLKAMLQKHGFQQQYLHEGGHDWRAPQSLAVIARKNGETDWKPVPLKGEAERVWQTLSAYRQTWDWFLAPKWYARSLRLGARRSLIRVARPLKRLLVGSRTEVNACGH